MRKVYEFVENRNAPIVKIVDQVGRVEKLGDRRVDVLLRLLESIGPVCDLRVVGVVENLVLATIRTIVVNEGVLAFPVLLSEDLHEKISRRFGQATGEKDTLLPHVVVELLQNSSEVDLELLIEGSFATGMACQPTGEARVSKFSLLMVRSPRSGSLIPHAKTL